MIPLVFIAKFVLTASLTLVVPPGDLPPVDSRVSLESVYAHPAEAVGRELCFYVQFDGLEEEWNPFGTGFSPKSHLRARVWSDDQRLWDRMEFLNPMGEVYLAVDSRAAHRLVQMSRYQRVLCLGRVRNLRCGRPWIEVTHLYLARQSVSEGSLLHAIRGVELEGRDAFSLARDEFARAITDELPKAVRSDLEGFIEACAQK